jgi:hypothetical protein
VCLSVARWQTQPQCWVLRSLCLGNSLTRSMVWQDEGEKEEEDDRLSRVTLEQANKIEKKKAKKEKGKAAFGWDIFNQDSLYNAHKKRLAKVRCRKLHLGRTNAKYCRLPCMFAAVLGPSDSALVPPTPAPSPKARFRPRPPEPSPIPECQIPPSSPRPQPHPQKPGSALVPSTPASSPKSQVPPSSLPLPALSSCPAAHRRNS